MKNDENNYLNSTNFTKKFKSMNFFVHVLIFKNFENLYNH